MASFFPACPVSQGVAGVYFFGAMHRTRVVVYIDYQNVQYCARDMFWPAIPTPPRIAGHVDPLKLGTLLCDLGRPGDPNRDLAGVRVYRGQPIAGRSREKARQFFDRQVSSWRQTPGVEVFTRPLRYHRAKNPDGTEYWAAREKGVDVLMALDISIGARSDQFDVAIIASADTDLIPALEDALRVSKRVETAAWGSPGNSAGPLRVKGRNLWNHYLGQTHFDLVRDETNYLAAL